MKEKMKIVYCYKSRQKEETASCEKNGAICRKNTCGNRQIKNGPPENHYGRPDKSREIQLRLQMRPLKSYSTSASRASA
jgi:hypothetical protein